MSFATARRDIEKRLSDNWGSTPIAFENVNFTPPDDSAWISLRIFEDRAVRKTVNNPATHRIHGMIAIYIHVPKNTGTNEGRGYADSLAALFRDAQFNGITCREASLSIPGDVDDWFQLSIAVPFYWDGVY